MAHKKLGRQTLVFEKPPRIISGATIVGDMEGKGPLGKFFDIVIKDDTWGEKTWEKAERKMFEESVRLAFEKVNLNPERMDCMLGGDLLNQIITASFAAREIKAPFLGLYGACSTMAESLILGSMLTDGGFFDVTACVASSHFSTAERQFRMPLEMGGQTPPTAQRTVTGVGCSVLASSNYEGECIMDNIFVTGGTVGRVVDMGISDANNMGAAMAPAAVDTLVNHLRDTERDISYYDLVITGDLGSFGSLLFSDMCKEKGVDLGDRHLDCGNIIFDKNQNVDCGGSGCGCSGSVLNGYLLKRMHEGDFERAFFMATGALMSPTASMQGETIPGIAHGVILERGKL
ncbi:MAG: stage V sporulation protein AD [Clostridia bacterium]|nr:stage V sporulation protein AD [Clostridia bacterium]